jgi:hypothetical protein
MSELLQPEQEALVAAAAETGLKRGEQLLRWFEAEGEARLVELGAGLPAGSRSWSFFGELELEGKPATVMGCVLRAVFPARVSRAEPDMSLVEWLGANFLQKCRWTGPDGLPGGFLYRPILVKNASNGSKACRVPAESEIRLAQIGSQYEWAAFRLDVLDYLKAFPTLAPYERWLRPFMHECGYMVFHPAFFKSPRPVPQGCTEEFCFGYAVAPWIVVPTFVAYGAGRFYAAMKQYRIFRQPDGSLLVENIFVVSNRMEKVLNFHGWDPIFGSVRLLDALTLHQTGINRRAHDHIDLFGLIHHARIHDNMLEGMRARWEGARAAGKSNS